MAKLPSATRIYKRDKANWSYTAALNSARRKILDGCSRQEAIVKTFAEYELPDDDRARLASHIWDKGAQL